MSKETVVTEFVKRIIAASAYEKSDQPYLVNQILGWIGEQAPLKTGPAKLQNWSTLELLDALVETARANGTLARLNFNADMMGAQLMNFFVPSPSQVNKAFQQRYAQAPYLATDYFYQLSRQTNYIKTREIARNLSFKTPTKYGDLEITINLSKPEKDPKQIAQAAKADGHNQYPANRLALENEGYWGRLDFPARVNHRVVNLKLGGENWGFQYSPYAYFPEHCIVFAEQDRPMHIDHAHLAQLFDFVDQFPDYFLGSNADLPIVGGSILSQDHFQGGKHDFPMAKAKLRESLAEKGFKVAEFGIVDWPMAVLRIADEDRTKVLELADRIMQVWSTYSDASLSIKAFDGDERHHTVTPIARKRESRYELDLVLRDNSTSQAFPDGIFHPHPDVQHIKKENIGLIEVMGLAILPPRLKTELAEVTKYLLDQPNQMVENHRSWADEIKDRHADINVNNVQAVVQDEVGQVFARVLADAGVFKDDAAGQAGFRRFIAALAKAK